MAEITVDETLQTIIKMTGGMVKMSDVWTNPAPANPFLPQKVAVKIDDFYEIIFAEQSSGAVEYSTGMIRANRRTKLQMNTAYMWERQISSVDSSSITFEQAQQIKTYGGSATVVNDRLVPLKIYSYKIISEGAS